MSDTSRLGRYEIRREIARSNDIVYEAVDTLLNRRVALKELALPPNLVGTAKRERIERFYREARAAGSLTHPNIVTIYEVGEDHGRHYIAMEYLEGQTLRQLLDVNGALPLPRAADILLQSLDALAYAHMNGVVHRDVKPDNLYLLPDGTVKLTDFGIARIMDEPSLTGAGQVFGTPSYMSPEQIAGKPVDERTDLYSLGVMAYEMLSGRKPFVGENVVALTYQILNVEPTPPAGLPPGLEDAVKRAMAKEPAERYQSAAQMAYALKGTAAGGAGYANSPNPAPANSVAVPGPHLSPGGFPNTPPGSLPTYPPGFFRRRKFSLSPGARQFLLALAGGLLLGTLVVAGMWGVRNAYSNYSQTFRVKASFGLYQEAVNAYNQRRYPEAVRDFTVVTRRARGTPLVRKAIDGIVQSYLQMGSREMGRDLGRAEAYYRAALKADPLSAQAHLYLGDLLDRQGHFDDAIQTWQRAAEIDGLGDVAAAARQNMATAYFNRGTSMFNMNDRVGAREYWQKAIDVDPAGPVAPYAQERINRLFPSAFPGP